MLYLACLCERSHGENCKLIALYGCFADRGELADHAQTLLGALWPCKHVVNINVIKPFSQLWFLTGSTVVQPPAVGFVRLGEFTSGHDMKKV